MLFGRNRACAYTHTKNVFNTFFLYFIFKNDNLSNNCSICIHILYTKYNIFYGTGLVLKENNVQVQIKVKNYYVSHNNCSICIHILYTKYNLFLWDRVSINKKTDLRKEIYLIFEMKQNIHLEVKMIRQRFSFLSQPVPQSIDGRLFTAIGITHFEDFFLSGTCHKNFKKKPQETTKF